MMFIIDKKTLRLLALCFVAAALHPAWASVVKGFFQSEVPQDLLTEKLGSTELFITLLLLGLRLTQPPEIPQFLTVSTLPSLDPFRGVQAPLKVKLSSNVIVNVVKNTQNCVLIVQGCCCGTKVLVICSLNSIKNVS